MLRERQIASRLRVADVLDGLYYECDVHGV